MISPQDYHNRTKHKFNNYARGPETLDWDDQPDPFRRFDDCPVFHLPKPGKSLPVTWSEVTQSSQQTPAPLTLDSIGVLMELAFGLAAWKRYGPDLWAVRCNPSSGNLHPSEAYIINGTSALMPQGVYHYVSHDHYLEQRCKFDSVELEGGLWLGLSSVHWREAWKYGERAFRYCQLDAGHAYAALEYAAATLGWRLEWCHEFDDSQISHLLGLDRDADFVKKESETPDWFCRIHYLTDNNECGGGVDALMSAVDQGLWQGKARSLKAYHMYHWKVIDEVSEATIRNLPLKLSETQHIVDNTASERQQAVTTLIRQRRSAQHFMPDADAISAEAFARILSAVKPGEKPPFLGWDLGTAIHLCFFVHKVEGLTPGLYCLPRSTQGKDLLQSEMSADFLWEAQKNFPGLYLLQKGDLRKLAKSLSCFQAIASDGAFSLAMLSEFKQNVTEASWLYRRLFWECGVIGQILYLEAEAEGYRGTGIGCFFDDEVHQIFGIQTDAIQSLYHFTVGVPFEDERIQTLPAYWHLQKKAEE